MKLDPEIKRILRSNLKDILYWSVLLEYFEVHREELSWFQQIIIYRKCEKYRNYWNIERLKKTTISKNGKEIPWTVPVYPLKIFRDEVKPDDIYKINKKLKFLAIYLSPHLIKLKIHSDWQNNT